MRRIDRRIVIVASVIFIIGLAYGLMRFLIAMKEPPPVLHSIESRRFVKVEPVRYTSIPSTVSGPGRLASVAEVDIVSEAAGRIESGEIALKKGAGFSEGDILFVIYPDEAILSLQARKSQYQKVLASILPDLVIDFPEYEAFFRQFFSAIRVDEPLPPLPEFSDEKLKIFLASRNVISEYYNIESDELQLSRRTLRAPFNGTYKEVYLEIGAYTNTGGRVARAIRTDGLELEVPLDRADASWVKIGDLVHVRSDQRGLTWEGRVIRKSQYVDENTQSQEVFVQIPYQSQKPLLAGEYLQATFPVRPINGVMEIPRNSVFNANEVFIVRNGRLARQEINVVKVNDRTLIFNGLEEGDSVVVQQLINVSEGTPVQLENDMAGSRQMNQAAPDQATEARQGGMPGMDVSVNSGDDHPDRKRKSRSERKAGNGP
jgi:membrane fusion protein (multidrug efflux system)